MKRKLLKLLPVAAVLLTASCVDDKYDLSDIDTESRFVAKGLVVPLNMSPVLLDNIISIEEDGDIKKDESGNYFFQKKSTSPFQSEDVNVEKITIRKPADISQTVTVAISLPSDVRTKWETYAADKTIAQIREDETLKSQIGLNDETEIISVDVNDSKDFNMNATGIDPRITKLNKLGIDPLSLNIDVKLNGLQAVVAGVPVTGLSIDLPCGMTVEGITDDGSYNAAGKLSFPTLVIDGQKNIRATVTELTYNAMEADGAQFNKNAHTFIYNKVCKVSGSATIKIKDLKGNATLADITNAVAATYSCNVGFSNDIVVNKFSGGIDYTIDNIAIDPVKIDNLPELLQESGTSIEIANPQLYLDINNPFFANNITAKAGLRIVSSNNVAIPEAPGGKVLTLDEANNKQVLSPENKDMANQGYKWVAFSELKNLLSGEKIPETLDIKVVNPVLNADNVINFTLGENHPGITGNWEFYARLSLTENSKIKYTKVWDDWGSEDLDGLTVEKATASFTVKKNVALDAESITFTLMGENGTDLTGTTALQGDAKQEISIPMEGGPVKNIKGGKLVVNLKGQGKDINKNDEIEISNLRLKVDGYYDKEF